MGVVDLSNILIYIGAGVRPIKEGEQVFKAKHIILCGKMNNLIMGLCLQSSKLNDHPHKIEINLFEDPAKWNCVCSCKAGAGGRCKHIVALLLHLNRIDDLEKLSTTDVEQTWGKAKTNKPMEVIPVNDFCHVTPFPLDVTIPENIALEFFQQCMEAVPSSEVALHVKKRTMINQQMNHKQPADESTPLISALHYQLNNPRECLLLLPKFSLPLHEESLYVTEIVTSLNDSVELAIKTKSQSLCPDWFSKRKKRITGSRAYELFTYCKNTNPNWEHKIKNIFDTKFYGNIATNYGQQHEHLAILKYEEISQKRVHKCGLIVHPSVPWLDCSPDGIVITQDRVEKIIEVKCPFKIANKSIIDGINSGDVDYLNTIEGKVSLKKRHKYYCQVQLLMGILNINNCDFVVYTAYDNSVCIVNVEFDEDFFIEVITCLNFVYFVFFLSILAKSSHKLL